MKCNARYIVVKTGIPATCQREFGHDLRGAGWAGTAHARVTRIGDVESGWGSYGPEPEPLCPHGGPYPAECPACKAAFIHGVDLAVEG